MSGALQFHSEAADVIDPVTFEVLRHRLWAVNEEHGSTLLKVSGSPAAIFAQDFNPGILTEHGEWVYCGPYVQFINSGADSGVRWLLEHRAERPGIHAGDMFVTNDPWIGSVHQQDLAILCPVFFEDRLFCWVTNTLHMYDMGGISPGSYCPTAKDVFDEAPIIPPLNLHEGGELRTDVQELLMRQSRLPNLLALDLNALVAGCHVARERIQQACARYGAPVVKAVMNKVISDAEAVFEGRLAEIPNGLWKERSYIEVSAVGDRGVYANVLSVRKEGTELYFSNTGSAAATGSINQTSVAWRGAIIAALNPCFLPDQMFAVGGALRHCHFEPEEGLINSAPHPFAVSNSSPCLSLNTVAITYNCLSRMLAASEEGRHRILAAGAMSTAAVGILSGINQWGDRYGRTTMDYFLGATGALSFKDGVDTGGNVWGPKGLAPNIEHNEQSFPVLYLWRRELPDSGGAGRFRGGNSGSFAVVPHGVSEVTHDVTAWGMAVPTSPGLFGGDPGAPNRIQMIRDSDVRSAMASGRIPRALSEVRGTPEAIPQRAADIIQAADDVWVFSWCAGGGYGDPYARPAAEVLRDVVDGHLTLDHARDAYGVAIVEAEGSWTVDEAATSCLRGSHAVGQVVVNSRTHGT